MPITPSKRLHHWGTKTLTTLSGFLKAKLLIVLILCIFTTRSLLGLGIYVALTLSARLNHTIIQISLVFVAGVLDIAIPSVPTAIGIYAAFVVSALTLSGVAQALAATLVLHLLQTLLPTLRGLNFMSGFSFKQKNIQNVAFEE